jgi:predicted DNA-binding protein YlxM (UPF0122 family)
METYDKEYLLQQIDTVLVQRSALTTQLQQTEQKLASYRTFLDMWNNCVNDAEQRDLALKVIATFNAQYPLPVVEPEELPEPVDE